MLERRIMPPESTLVHAGGLFQLVESLKTRFACERSIRLCPRRLLTNRFLLTVTKQDIPRDGDAAVLDVCRRLPMPAELEEAVRANLSAARFVHFGFEENETTSIYKVYLEFDPNAASRQVGENGEILLHLAFKWDIAEPSRHVVTKYWLHQSLSTAGIVARLAEVYGSIGASYEIAAGIVQLTAGRSPHEPAYLEVREDANERRSFDVNLYDANLQVQDLAAWLEKMCAYFEIPVADFQPHYDKIKTKRFGHLAGGTHRRGQDFFNLYYGVEWHDGTTRPGRAGWAMKLVERFEHSTGQDQYYNYCWWPYLPVTPVENKYRPVNLLFQSFDLAGMDERAFQLVRRIQEAIGLFRTVWGVKWLPAAPHPLEETPSPQPLSPDKSDTLGGCLAWEFYFYDYQRREREISITRVLEAIKPVVRGVVPVNESLPYFMFSLDVNGDLVTGKSDLDVVHMYIGNPGSRVSSGIAYAVTAQQTKLENFYFFFDARRDLRPAAEKVLCSAHVDAARVDIDRILRPELRDCHTICVANKQGNDTAYFSGVNVDQLLTFLRLLRYPAAIVTFVEQNRGKFDHLLYDVGFDYVAKGDELIVLKSGYYGVF
jgi:hypothetical protein